MVTNDRINELQKWIMASRLETSKNDWAWYEEMNEALDELKVRRRDASYRGKQ